MECGKWGTLKESQPQAPVTAQQGLKAKAAPAAAKPLASFAGESLQRIVIEGFPTARLFPGGLVRGSTVLISGEPGAGKSTLCLQIASQLSTQHRVLYICAEESAQQVHERASRIGTFGEQFSIAESTSVEQIIATALHGKPAVLVVDSLQAIATTEVSGDAGSIAQVRAVTAMLSQLAHQERLCILLVGHVTKDGALAGPKALEHAVDVVLYLEGDRRTPYRLMRSFKNRYGESGKVIVMSLGQKGMIEVADAATIFIQQYAAKPGSVITIAEVDDQLFFLEVQALATKSSYGYAKRAASGFSRQRLEVLLAIIKKHVHVDTDGYDVYVNIAGGFHVHEPAMDAAVVLAVLSSIKDAPLPEKTIIFGEVGLSGELRVVKDTAARLKEIERHKFTHALVPPLAHKIAGKLSVLAVASVQEAVKKLDW